VTVAEALGEHPFARVAFNEPEYFRHTCIELFQHVLDETLVMTETNGWKSIGFPSFVVSQLDIRLPNGNKLTLYRWMPREKEEDNPIKAMSRNELIEITPSRPVKLSMDKTDIDKTIKGMDEWNKAVIKFKKEGLAKALKCGFKTNDYSFQTPECNGDQT